VPGRSQGASEAAGNTNIADARSLGLLLALAGGSYPIWWLISPHAANPVLPWLAIGVSYLVVGVSVSAIPHKVSPYLVVIPAAAVTVHLETLFLRNPREPFYPVAAIMSVAAALPILHGNHVRGAYFAIVVALSLAQLVIGAVGTEFLAIALGVTLLFFGYQAVSQEQASKRLGEVARELAKERVERDRLIKELEVVQRMNSLGRLAGTFCHEFNNQLMAIRVHADLLNTSLPPDSLQRRDVAQILRTTSSAAELTERLLAFSRPTRACEEPADICNVLQQFEPTLRHLVAEKTKVAFDVPEYPVHVPVGAKQISQILLNLAINAQDAMPGGGSLRVELACIPTASVELPIEISVPTLVRLTVADTGCGMSEHVRDMLFEPFFTTKTDRKNSGLGLSVVYGIVKETGGHIRVTSEPDDGAHPCQGRPPVDLDAARPSATRRRSGRAARRAHPLADRARLRGGRVRDCGGGAHACRRRRCCRL
jgi:signal transduction histidine kinase